MTETCMKSKFWKFLYHSLEGEERVRGSFVDHLTVLLFTLYYIYLHQKKKKKKRHMWRITFAHFPFIVLLPKSNKFSS